MCGIAGIIYSDPTRPVRRDVLTSMLTAIQHRGPDDEGVHIDEHVGLGMRRLSIIDLSGGHQPIYNETRDRVIVFNGEIYNYRELRRDLESRGHRFRTASDTETIVHLHEEVGPGCVDELRGMFGFAIWDSVEKELLLARDHFGIKPLYWLSGSWGIAFASELKALLAAGLVERDLDWPALEGVFRVGYVAAPRTPFKGVHKLEPGHTLTWHPDRGATTKRYWDLPVEEAKPRADPEAAVLAQIDDTVRAHLIADVPVAAFLSGGLDSSAVVSSMAMAGEGAHAYTVRYLGSGGAESDETPLAQALAKRYGIQLTVVDVDPDVEAVFEPIVTALDEPHGDESAVPTWLICERVSQEYKVALAGTGGDELFAGYRRHLGLAASGLWQRLPASLRKAAGALIEPWPEPRGGGLGITRLKRFVRSSGDSLALRYLSLQDRLGDKQLFTADLQEEVSIDYVSRLFERHAQFAPRDGAVRPALYLDYKTYLPEDLLHLSDRISMAHSLELRVPLVDRKLVSELFTLPDSTRVGWGKPKRLLRRALRSRLPPEFFNAPKRGFIGPTAMWLRNELAPMLADELSAARLSRLGFFDPQAVNRLRVDHIERRQNNEGVLWALLCFLTWHRTFVEQPASALAG